MKAYLIGQNSGTIKSIVHDLGIETVESIEGKPDFCICFGGDGTLLGSERDYPGLPKVPIRQRPNDENAHREFKTILERVVEGKHNVTYLPKIKASANGESMLAINDVVLHNSRVVSAVRFEVEIEGLQPFGEIVGDGLVAATPFGSSAYYRAITNSVIHVGIGLAFNNTTEPVNHLVLSEKTSIDIKINRGPAILVSDNNPRHIDLDDGDRATISVSDEHAEIWEIDNLLCMKTFMSQSGRRLRWLEHVSD